MIIPPAEIQSVKRSALLQVIAVVQNTDRPLVSNAINSMTADKIHTCHCGGLNVAEKCTYYLFSLSLCVNYVTSSTIFKV
jgi:hypothetical protein